MAVLRGPLSRIREIESCIGSNQFEGGRERERGRFGTPRLSTCSLNNLRARRYADPIVVCNDCPESVNKILR